MRTVAIVQQSLRRYRAAFYEELRARLADADVELRLIETFPCNSIDDRGDRLHLDWAVQAAAREMPFFGRELVWQRVWGATRGADLVIVEQGSRLLVNYVLLAAQHLGILELAYWGHGRTFHTEAAHPGGEWLKRFTSRRVHWWFAYNELAVEIVSGLGFPPERITDVRNSTDVAHLQALVAGIGETDRLRLLDQLGLEGKRVGAYIGSMTPVKQLGFVFAAADRIRSRHPDFELVLAGAGPEADRARAFAGSREWVRVVGPRHDADLAGLLSVAKVVLVPCGVGLVVVDAFAAGVPLAASASASHGPEIAYLRHGENGLLVADGGDAAAYADAVADVLCDETRHAELVSGCRRTAATLGAANMAERFACGVLEALDA